MSRYLLAAMLVVLAACGTDDRVAISPPRTTTTTTRPVVVPEAMDGIPATDRVLAYVNEHASRSKPKPKLVRSPTTTTRPKPKVFTPAVQTPTNTDFWRRLANCENPSGNAPGGYFQFMGSTRRKVGWHPGLSYEEQRRMAIFWAMQIHPREGTKAGWPHCWWVALKG